MEIRKQKEKQVGRLTVTEQIDQKHQEDLQRLRGFRLLDDDFFTKCFEGDTASIGAKLNVKVQRSDKGAGRKRARYNSSMMDANLLKKGEDFDKLPETWVIFITENDVMGKGLPLYPIERCFLGTGERFEDGSHILYVNGAYRGDTPIGKLMHDFSCTDAADMYYGTLADRVRFFKESKEGIEIMCRAMEDMRNQTLKDGMINVAKKMLEDGTITLEKIAEFVGLSVEEVKKIKTDQNIPLG